MRWLVLAVTACSSSPDVSITDEDLAGRHDLRTVQSSDLAGADLVSVPGEDLAQLQLDMRGAQLADMAGAHDMGNPASSDMVMCLAALATCTDPSQCCNGYGCSSYNGNPSMKCWQGLGQACAQDSDCKPQTSGPAPTCLGPSGEHICCQWTITANGCGAGKSKFCHECSPGVTICDPC
jgi:hypothetical protein